MTEGSVFIVLIFPDIWPPNKNQLILKEKANESMIEMIGLTNGQLLFTIDSETFESQKIKFTNAKRALISIHWNTNKSQKIQVFINSKELAEKNQKDVFIISSKPEIINDKKSFELPESKKVCAEWIAWRKSNYGEQKMQPKKDRSLKTIDVQFQELTNSLESLASHIEVFKNKENLLLMNVLPILRALLFWPDKKSKNYNPLLFRLAGYLDLPLPLFAFKDRIKETKDSKLYKDATIHRVNNFPSIIKKYPNEKLMDFQEWLNMDIIIDKSVGSKEMFRWKDILFESANTVSNTHFDDDIPLIIDSLKKSIIWDKSTFSEYIFTICQTTLELGNYILKEKNCS